MYSKPIQQLIAAFSKLPSVGERTAERFVFYLLKSGKKEATELALALKGLIEQVKSCEICCDFADSSPCPICASKTRERQIICVVAQPQDVQTIERTGEYNGLYHILRGTLSTAEDNLEELRVKELLSRIKTARELILALNPDLPGENTMLYLQREIKKLKPNVKITRLARGLPMGSDLQYADEITLCSALKHRQAA